MKKLLILTLAFIMCLTLVGCGETEETDTTIDKTTQESEDVGDTSVYDYDYSYTDDEDYYEVEYELEDDYSYIDEE